MGGLGRSAIVLAICATVSAQAPPAPASAPLRNITGTVVNAISGEPIKHALVQLFGPHVVAALTGPDGRFEMEGVPDGPLNFSVSKPGYFDIRNVAQSEWNPYTPLPTSDSSSGDISLKLFPAGKVKGQVTDSDDEPVSQVQVQFMAEAIVGGRRQWQVRGTTTTDDDGAYRFDNLTPGTYVVHVLGRTFPAPAWNAQPQVTPPEYFGDAPDLASAQKFRIEPGQEFQADIRLHRQTGYRITGSVLGFSRGAAMMLSLEDRDHQQVEFDAVRTDSQRGQFSAVVAPGNWVLNLSSTDEHGTLYRARQDVSVSAANITDLRLVLHSSMMIPVVVNHAADVERPEGAVSPDVAAQLIDPDSFNGYWIGRRQTGGPVGFYDVPEGRYRLQIQNTGAECLDSAWYGNVDLTRELLTVTADVQPQPVTINLRNDCATLSVKLDEAEQRTGYVVIASNSLALQPIIFPVQPHANESLPYVPFTGLMLGPGPTTLPPGSYEVYAFSTLENVEYANPEALKAYTSQSITLDPKQKLEVTAMLIDPRAK